MAIDELSPAVSGVDLPVRKTRRPVPFWLFAGWTLLSSAWIALTLLPYPLRQEQCPAGWAACTLGERLLGAPTNMAFVTTVAIVAGAVAIGLLVLWRWDARQPAPAEQPAQPAVPMGKSKLVRLLLASIAGVIGAGHLMLLAPVDENAFCVEFVHLNEAMAYPFNCDSPLFIEMSHSPGMIFDHNNTRQSRPAYIAAGAVLERVVDPVMDVFGIESVYGQSDSGYAALLLLNFLVAATALALLAWLMLRMGTPVWVIAGLGALLIVNEVTKAFIWTPHQQMFALLVPVLTVVIGRWLILSRPSWRPLLLAGLGVGVVALLYGNAVVTAVVVGLILLARKWEGARLAALFGSAFASVTIGWMVLCKLISGSYYNQEVAVYNQFIWPVVEAREGLRNLGRWIAGMGMLTLYEFVLAGFLALFAVVGLLAIAVLVRVRFRLRSAEDRAIVIPAILTIAVSFPFIFGLGMVAVRLMFVAVPALLILGGWAAALIAQRSQWGARAAGAFVSACVAAAVLMVVAMHGPYS